MNIFYLDEDPEQAARWHCDKHVSKMVVEYAQILSTAAHMNDWHKPERMYKPIPNLNPKVHKWAAASEENYRWLYNLGVETAKEFEYRYGKEHASYTRVIAKIDPVEIQGPNVRFSEPPQCMPGRFKVDGDAVAAYRDFYNRGKTWSLSWFKRDVPPWYTEGVRYYREEDRQRADD